MLLAHRVRGALCLVLCLAIVVGPLPRVVRTTAYASDANEQAAEELTAGIEAYQAGKSAEAVAHLTRAQTSAPDNSTIALYLGLAYLKQNELEEAIAVWQRYTKLEPSTAEEKDADLSGQVRRYLTLLEREENERLAKQAIAEEKSLGAGDANAIAVSYFQNLGSSEIAPLRKGMAALLIADLAKVPGLKVVEREKVQALLGELRLSQSGLVAKTTAPRVGKMLGAGKVATGSYREPAKGELKVDSVLANTATSAVVGAQAAEGPLDQFWEVENALALEILASLGYDGKRLAAEGVADQIATPATKSLPAFVAFSQGLDAKDRQDYPAAGVYFETALREDPSFELARAELLALPAAAVGVAAIASSVSSSAPTAAAASAGLVGAAAGISTTTLLVGGGLIVAGGIAAGIAAGSGGGDGPPPAQCKEEAQSCSGTDCCAGLECQGSICCLPNGSECAPGSSCCSSMCIDGTCGVCTERGDACTSSSQCCSGLSCDASICKDCMQGASCSSDADCCAGSRCDGTTCEPNPCPPGDNFCNDPGEQDNCPVGQVCAPDCQSCTCPVGAACSTPGGSDGCPSGLVCAEDCSGCVCPAGSQCTTPGSPAGCAVNEVCDDQCECVCACETTSPCGVGQICNPETCACQDVACDDWSVSGMCECSFEGDSEVCRITSATIDNTSCDVALEIPANGIEVVCQLPPSETIPVPIPVGVPARQSQSLPPGFDVDIGFCEMGRVDATASTGTTKSVEIYCGTSDCAGTGASCVSDECCGDQVCEDQICQIPASTP